METEESVNTHGIANMASLLLMENWQARLKSHMKARGIKQADIADRLGMTQGGVGHWLTGRNEITLTDFARLCRAAEANPQQVMFGTAPSGTELINEIKRLVSSSPTTESAADLQTARKAPKQVIKRPNPGKKRTNRQPPSPRIQ